LASQLTQQEIHDYCTKNKSVIEEIISQARKHDPKKEKTEKKEKKKEKTREDWDARRLQKERLGSMYEAVSSELSKICGFC
jgi:hypothetical protein